MSRTPRRVGGGRPHPVWVLAAVLAVAGLISLTLGLTDGSSPPVTSAAGSVPGPDAPPARSVGSTGPADGPAAAPRAPAGRPASLPASPPTSLTIPAIGVTTGLDPLGLNPDRTVEVPTDFARAGWYTGAPTPGQDGPAVVLGHIDSYRGPAVFYRLGRLRPGDTVEITRADGLRTRFVVDAVREYPKDRFPTEEVYGALDYPGLRLITCGGPFDSDTRNYLNNVVVFARMISSTQAAEQTPPPDPRPAAPGPTAALAGLTGPPTLYGRVVSVTDPFTAVVEVQRRRITVSVIGLDAAGTPACARDEATAFARRMLTGETVTLVPDPTLPTDPDAPTWPAYLVLDNQQSYTDAAITAGWAGAGQGRYRPGFLAGQQQAQDADLGMWGPPCNRPTAG